MTEIIVALITAAAGVLGVVVTNKTANEKMVSSMSTAQAVTDEKIKELTREVREHNEFAKRIPQLELRISSLESQVKDLKALHPRQN